VQKFPLLLLFFLIRPFVDFKSYSFTFHFSFSLSFILLFSHSHFLSFSLSLILTFSHSHFLTFSHSLILSFSHSQISFLILSHFSFLILIFSHQFANPPPQYTHRQRFRRRPQSQTMKSLNKIINYR
jgi:hypothetical protein